MRISKVDDTDQKLKSLDHFLKIYILKVTMLKCNYSNEFHCIVVIISISFPGSLKDNSLQKKQTKTVFSTQFIRKPY